MLGQINLIHFTKTFTNKHELLTRLFKNISFILLQLDIIKIKSVIYIVIALHGEMKFMFFYDEYELDRLVVLSSLRFFNMSISFFELFSIVLIIFRFLCACLTSKQVFIVILINFVTSPNDSTSHSINWRKLLLQNPYGIKRLSSS